MIFRLYGFSEYFDAGDGFVKRRFEDLTKWGKRDYMRDCFNSLGWLKYRFREHITMYRCNKD